MNDSTASGFGAPPPGPRKRALITGVTGQDGSYLAELLLEKGYEVHGVKRRASLFNTQRVDHLYRDLHERGRAADGGPLFRLHYGDMVDASHLTRVVQEVQPDEIYNLAAQSHVAVSFETPEYTADAGALGPLRLLEAVRLLGMTDRVRFYQASTSELFGQARETPQSEATPFYPRSPYGAAKLYAYWITVNYREAYGLYAANGILFNHESPRRGETFVTRKVTRAAARIAEGLDETLWLGNLDARRDWGHARDYVEGMWRILQHPAPDDWVLATGRAESVRRFCELAFAAAGLELAWEGTAEREIGRRTDTGAVVVRVDPRYYRPTEVEALVGDASKARRALGWAPRVTLEALVEEMTAADLDEARREASGLRPPRPLPAPDL